MAESGARTQDTQEQGATVRGRAVGWCTKMLSHYTSRLKANKTIRTERENLPSPNAPGLSYRTVRIHPRTRTLPVLCY